MDVLGALQSCITNEVSNVGVLCGTRRTPLARLARSSEFVTVAEFSSPAGKDGFLAVNSLLAFAVLLTRIYFEPIDTQVLPENLSELLGVPRVEDFLESVTEGDLRKVIQRETLVVLYGPDTKPAALDLESKFTEAALGRVQPADFRNFGHGRHHWLAKRWKESGIVALCGPEDLTLAKKTIALLPRNVPHVIATFAHSIVRRQLSALIYAMVFAGSVGKVRGIDPGKPGVPEFGRKIYHLKARSTRRLENGWRESVIRRKVAAVGVSSRNESVLRALSDAMENELTKFAAHDFRALVVDYDGTMCTAQERFDGPSERMSQHLSRLLEAGVLVGIATGRGDSVRTDLRKILGKNHWACTWIGYHNGGEIGRLDDDSLPAPVEDVCSALREIKRSLEADPLVQALVDLRFRPSQITLRPKQAVSIAQLLALGLAKVNSSGAVGVRAVSSTHSVDIIAPGVSKVNLLEHLRTSHLVEHPGEILCLGDRGRFPGNDFELLAHKFALSVDEVSADLGSGWNLAPPGCRGILATLHYMGLMKTTKPGRFHLDFSGMPRA